MFRISAITAALFLFAGNSISAGDIFVREEAFSYSVDAGSDVIINNINGNIIIEEGDSDNLLIECSIEGENIEEVEAIEIECKYVNGVICEVTYPDDWDEITEAAVDFHVSLPSSMELNLVMLTYNGCISLRSGAGTSLVEIINGSAILEGFSGELIVNVVSGEIDLVDIQGLSVVNIVEGTITGTIDSIDRDIDISTVEAFIDLVIDCPAIVSVTTMTGDLDIPGVEIVHDLVGSSAEFGEGEFKIEITTYSGNVRIQH